MVNTGMVVDRIPAGLEIENMNISQGEGMGSVTIGGVNPAEDMQDARILHVEFREDRLWLRSACRGKLRLYYRARAVTPGKFVFPPFMQRTCTNLRCMAWPPGDASLVVTDAKEAQEQAPSPPSPSNP